MHVTGCDSLQKHGEFGVKCVVICSVTSGVMHVTHSNSRLKFKINRQHPFSNFSQQNKLRKASSIWLHLLLLIIASIISFSTLSDFPLRSDTTWGLDVATTIVSNILRVMVLGCRKMNWLTFQEKQHFLPRDHFLAPPKVVQKNHLCINHFHPCVLVFCRIAEDFEQFLHGTKQKGLTTVGRANAHHISVFAPTFDYDSYQSFSKYKGYSLQFLNNCNSPHTLLEYFPL